MKFFVFIFLVIILSSCSKEINQKLEILPSQDSLKFSLNNKKMNARILQMDNEYRIRPFSIIYKKNLIVLNRMNSFDCYKINNFTRNISLEKKLNKKEFKKSMLISDTLFALGKNDDLFFFSYSDKKWEKYSKKLPFNNSIPSYENKNYLCYTLNRGEWGGYTIFFNKSNENLTFLPSNDGVNLTEKNDNYKMISTSFSLKHSSIITFKSPDSLYNLPEQSANSVKWFNINNLNEIIRSNPNKNLSFEKKIMTEESEILFGFNINDQEYYLRVNQKNDFELTTLVNDSLLSTEIPERIFNYCNLYPYFYNRKIGTTIIIDNAYYDFASTLTNLENATAITFIITDTEIIRLNWNCEFE